MGDDILEVTSLADPNDVHLDLNDGDGVSGNPYGLKTRVVSIDFSTRARELEWFAPSSRRGDILAHLRDGNMAMVVKLQASAGDGTYRSLREAASRMESILKDGRARQIVWQAEGEEVRYVRYRTCEPITVMRGQDDTSALLRRGIDYGLTVVIWCEPDISTDEAEVGSGTVTLDPTAGSMGLVVTNDGDVETPAGLTLSSPNAAAQVAEIVLAMRSEEGVGGAKSIDDLLAETCWANLGATGGGWVLAYANGTASSDDTTNGSIGNAALVSASQSSMLQRVRLSRTTKLDSLRGWERMLVRVRKTVAGDVWDIKMRAAPSLASPVPTAFGPVARHNVATTAYVELDLGYIKVPEDPETALAGVAAEIFAQRVSGSGNLRLDITRHLPATPGRDVLTRIVAPSAVLAVNQKARTDPKGLVVRKLDSADKLLEELRTEGPVPFWIPPGRAVVFAVPLDTPRPTSVRARTLMVSARAKQRSYAVA